MRRVVSFLVAPALILGVVGAAFADSRPLPAPPEAPVAPMVMGLVRYEPPSDLAILPRLLERPDRFETPVICGDVPVEGCIEPLPEYDPFTEAMPTRPSGGEDWRQLVALFFEPEHVDRAVRVITCESGGDPDAKNPSSSASGLFQHLGSLWGDRIVKAGWEGADIWDPVANVGVAAWLVYEGGGWGHWNPSRYCWG